MPYDQLLFLGFLMYSRPSLSGTRPPPTNAPFASPGSDLMGPKLRLA